MPERERAVGTRLDGSIDVDVAIVGAGMTGLWTAWYLLQRDPTLDIAIVERETVGFGASGRNGGWCSALLPTSLTRIARRHGTGAAQRMQQAMHDSVTEVENFVASRGARSIVHRGGTIDLARSAPQAARLRHEIEEYHGFGFDDEDYRWLDAAEATAMCAAEDTLGAMYTPHCATVHPLRLTHAIGRAVLAAGAKIYEHTTATAIEPGKLITEAGIVRAQAVIRATEGYTPQFVGQRRSMLPIYSMMIATEPLPSSVWESIGLADRPTFADGRHLVIYGQRTTDGRLAFGGRGAPYHFGSEIRSRFDTNADIADLLQQSLVGLFPQIRGVDVTHHWGGVLGAPRDWTCSVTFDRATGLGAAGGYVGDGVSTTNLAGRTLAALVTGATDEAGTELIRLPWVGHRSRQWEPEPLRWIGVNTARIAAQRADLAESRTGQESRLWGGLMNALLRR